MAVDMTNVKKLVKTARQNPGRDFKKAHSLLKFKEWMESSIKSMKKIKHKESNPKGVRNFKNDLSKDYKGHIAHNGDVEPWKLVRK